MPPDVPPVIDKLYTLILWLLPHIAKFPRSERFVLGDRIERSVLDVQDLLIEAAYSRRKTDLLKRANIQLEQIRYLVRLAKDLQLFSLRQYQYAAEHIDEVGRMVGGWIQQQERRR